MTLTYPYTLPSPKHAMHWMMTKLHLLVDSTTGTISTSDNPFYSSAVANDIPRHECDYYIYNTRPTGPTCGTKNEYHLRSPRIFEKNKTAKKKAGKLTPKNMTKQNKTYVYLSYYGALCSGICTHLWPFLSTPTIRIFFFIGRPHSKECS